MRTVVVKDEIGDVVEFTEFSDNDELLRNFKAIGNKLFKTIKNKRVIITFKQEIKLFVLEIDGFGTRVSAAVKGKDKIILPEIDSRAEIDQDIIDGFTVKGDLLDSWLNNL